MKWDPKTLGMLLAALLLPWGSALGATAAPAPPFDLSLVEGKKLSARIKEVPLGAVLDRLARLVPLRIYYKGPVWNQKVSATFNDLSLEEGIKRVLSGTSYVLNRKPSDTKAGKEQAAYTIEIRIATSNTGVAAPAESKTQSSAAPQKALDPARARSLQTLTEQALHAPDVQKRIVALETLHGEYSEEEALPTLVRALQDKSETVRLTALRLLSDATASEGGEPVPYGPIASLATQDTSPEVRRLALKLASDIDEGASTELLKQATADPDPRISRVARVLLKVRSLGPPQLPPELEKHIRQ